MAYKTYIAAI